MLGHAVRCIRADADARGVRRRVVLAHGWVTGGAACESERDITVGGVGQVPAEVFGGFSYAALGHLHGQQTLAPHLRYSGSPLPYSFSEATHHKGSWLVELDGAGTARAERVPAPGYRRLSVLRGRLAELLESGTYVQYEDDFLSVTLTDQSRPEGAMDALRARFPHVLVLIFEPEGVTTDGRGYRDRVAGRDDLAVAAEFVQHVRGAPATPGRAAPAGRGVPGRPDGRGRLMRPHRLRVTAFGAFGGTVEVCFDDLAQAGLFLLHGETGAGKTTLLDALGFALYGRVPGERGKARRLRSDHAAADVPTEIQLEATLGGRRMRITRRPEQERPKRRGGGTTTEHAKILLEESDRTAWRAVSTRAGEADDEIKDLMGMSAEQFFQVVLLPQGQFAEFLHADAKDRRGCCRTPVRHRPVPGGGGLARRPAQGDRTGGQGGRRRHQGVRRPDRPGRRQGPGARRRLQGAGRRPQGAGRRPQGAGRRPPGAGRRPPEAAGRRVGRRAGRGSPGRSRRPRGHGNRLPHRPGPGADRQQDAERLAERQRRRADALRARDELAAAAPALDDLRRELAAAARAAEAAGALTEAERTSQALARARDEQDQAAARAGAAPGATAAGLRAAGQQHVARLGRLDALRALDQQAAEEDDNAAAARAAGRPLAAQLAEAEAALAARQERRPLLVTERDQARAGEDLPAVPAEADTLPPGRG